MTSANISDITANISMPMSSKAKTSPQAEDNSVDFLSMMASQTMDVTGMTIPESGQNYDMTDDIKDSSFNDLPVSETKVNVSKSASKRPETNPKADNKENLSPKDISDAKDKIDDYKKDVTATISANLGVSEEEIEATLEELGLTFTDLINPNNLLKLIGALEGGADTSNLLVNNKITDMISDIGELSNNLLAETNLDAGTIKEVEMEFKASSGIDISALGLEAVDNVEVLDDEVITIKNEQAPVLLDDIEDASINTRPLQSVDEDTIEEKPDNETKVEVSNTTVKNIVTKDSDTTGSNANGNQTGNQPMNSGSNNSENTVVSGENSFNTTTSEAAETPNTVNSYVNVNTQNVIEQIVTAARTQITASVRSMELELNPLNLGKMLMRVVESEGQITAKIYTQNEAVKQALEGQLTLLKEQLSQQGIKVEAVEVAVGTHEFEENLEDGQKNLAQEELEQQLKEEQRKNATRGIHLGDPSLMGEEPLSEADELTAKIMKDEGNTVNFRA